MVLELYATDIPELTVSRDYTEIFDLQEAHLQERCTTVKHPLAKGSYREIYFDGIHIGYGSLSLARKTLIHFESDFETVEMHFALNGCTSAFAGHPRRTVSFRPKQHNIVYANHFSGKMEWSGEDIQVFEVNMTPSFFRKYLPENSPVFDAFQKRIGDGFSTLISEHHQLINLQMFRIIQDIIQCERKGVFKRMFLEAKVIELLLLQLEQLCDDEAIQPDLKRTDTEKIYAVRDYILNNLTRPCSLIDLAHKAGTNEFALKKGFKELFGTTVFGFWNDAKMDEAKKMLQTGQMNVAEVSDAIGYKNPQHFTAAFKRKFGVVPSRV